MEDKTNIYVLHDPTEVSHGIYVGKADDLGDGDRTPRNIEGPSPSEGSG